jgi:hypothetical protein
MTMQNETIFEAPFSHESGPADELTFESGYLPGAP